MRARVFLTYWLALVASAALAAVTPERLADFAYGLTLQTDSNAALHRLELPAAVYRSVAGRGLADLRVFNAAGEVVPHAFDYRMATDVRKSAPIGLKIFPFYGEAAQNLDGIALQVERSATGTVIKLNERRTPGAPKDGARRLLAYLIDASALTQPLRAMELDVNADTGYVARLTLEASNDLAAWTRVVAAAPIVSLEHGGELLVQRRIEFPATKSKYFRLSWAGMPQEARLAAVRGELGDIRIDTQRQWEAVIGTVVADKPGEYLFDAKGHFPSDRLRLELPQANTVAQIQLLSRNRVQDPWRPMTRSVAYRLLRDGDELRSPNLAIGENADRYWLLKVDSRGGGIGAGQPRLDLGWLPHEMVFAARGAGPFTLAFGSREATASAYPIESLVPGYRADQDTGIKIATAKLAVSAGDPTQAATPASLGGAPVVDERIDTKKWILWACLVLGVLFLGWMAWRLLKQMNAEADAVPPGDEARQTSSHE